MIYLNTQNVVANCIIAKNGGDGIYVVNTNARLGLCINNTIDANTGNGINFTTQASVSMTVAFNNIISNHVTGGTYGITVGAGTAAQNSLIQGFVNKNTFYNNTTDTNAINYGANDTHGGSNPYVGQTTENYTLA